MSILKKTAIIRRIVIFVFIIINCALILCYDIVFSCLLGLLNFFVLFGMIEDHITISLLFSIVEIISMLLLFYNKNFKIKLIANSIIQIFCAIDIIIQIYSIHLSSNPSECFLGIIIDTIFWILILYDIIMTNKERVKGTETQGNDSSVCD